MDPDTRLNGQCTPIMIAFWIADPYSKGVISGKYSATDFYKVALDILKTYGHYALGKVSVCRDTALSWAIDAIYTTNKYTDLDILLQIAQQIISLANQYPSVRLEFTQKNQRGITALGWASIIPTRRKCPKLIIPLYATLIRSAISSGLGLKELGLQYTWNDPYSKELVNIKKCCIDLINDH